MQSGGDTKHVPGAVGKIRLAIHMNLEIRGDARERIRHADGQCLWLKEEGMAVVQFLVKFTSFFGFDVKARGSLLHAGRTGCVREMAVDKSPYLPEDIYHLRGESPFSISPLALASVLFHISRVSLPI